ncbi:MAG: YceI family protein [Terracidiphilus sp.]
MTRPVSKFEVNGFAADPGGGNRAGFSAIGEINRLDFGVSSGTAPSAVVCARVGLRSCVRPGAGGAGTVRRVCGRRRGR